MAGERHSSICSQDCRTQMFCHVYQIECHIKPSQISVAQEPSECRRLFFWWDSHRCCLQPVIFHLRYSGLKDCDITPPRESSLSCPTNWDIINEIFPQGKLLDVPSTIVTESSLSPAGLYCTDQDYHSMRLEFWCKERSQMLIRARISLSPFPLEVSG